MYKVEVLKKEDATELFTWKAFKNKKVNSSYNRSLNQALSYASGLPLALEVIGSNLSGKSIEEWESALKQYGRIPPKKIQKILEVSFDALEEEEKNVFLDIACCLKGYKLKEVKDILCAHYDFSIENHIRVLVQKSLINVTFWDEVALHDLIKDMGKEIVRRESPKEPGKRSRLWSHEDTVNVLEENTGTREIEILCLDSSKFKVEWDGKAFKKMTKLKTLIVKNCQFSRGPEHLPKSLRVLVWWGYPSKHLPCDFCPEKISICQLPMNCTMSMTLSRSSKVFVNMKVLNLNNCRHLTEIGDVSSLVNLEEFSLRSCESLITIHDSVGMLGRLKILNAYGCDKLRSFPPLELPSLEELDLSGCSSLECFPEILEKMENIIELNLMETNMIEFPSSCQNLTRLRKLTVSTWPSRSSLVRMQQLHNLTVLQWTMKVLETHEEAEEKVSSMLQFSNVKRLNLSNCILSDEFLAVVLPWFPHLKELDLTWSTFRIVPDCIKQCRYLSWLKVDFCYELQEIEGIPPSLKYLSAKDCIFLGFSFRSMLLKQEFHEAGNTDFLFPNLIPERGRVPGWFEQQSRGPSPSVSFWFRNNFPNNLLLCLASPPTKPYLGPARQENSCKLCLIVNGETFYVDVEPYYQGHTHIFHMLRGKFKSGVYEAPLKNGWNHVTVMMKGFRHVYAPKEIKDEFGVRSLMEKRRIYEPNMQIRVDIGIHVLKDKSCMEDIQFTDPNENNNFDSHLSLINSETYAN